MATRKTETPKTPATAKTAKAERIEQHGVKRVLRGACAEVWDALDAAPEKPVTPEQCHDIAAALGQRVAYVQIVLRQWKMFNGVSAEAKQVAPAKKAPGAKKKAPAKQAAAAAPADAAKEQAE